MWKCDNFLKMHTTRVSDMHVKHVSDTTQLHDRSVNTHDKEHCSEKPSSNAPL